MEKIKALCASRYKNYYGKPFELTDGQADIFEIIAKRKFPRTHCMAYTRYGKSETVSMAVLTRITTFPEKWAIVAPSGKKAKIIMSALINHTFDNEYTMAMFDVGQSESLERIRRERSKERMTFKHSNGQLGEVFTLSSEGKRTNDLLDALMGFGSPNIILDESSLIDDVQYAGVFRMLGDQPDNFLFEIGNPLRRNHFLRTSLDPAFHHININYEQGVKEGRITKEFIEEMRNKPMFEQLYENKFPPRDAVDNGGFSPLYSEEDLFSKFKPKVEIFGEERLGVDIAGEGSNYSVIILRGHNGAKILYKENNPDTMNFAGIIASMAREYNPSKIYIDKVGIGKPVFDRLNEFGEINDRLVGVVAGEKAEDDKNFFNKRAEMFWRMREWLAKAELEGNNWNDLLDIKYKIQSDRRVKIKSKDEMLKDGVVSPDVADALSLTFYDNETEGTTKRLDDFFQRNISRSHLNDTR